MMRLPLLKLWIEKSCRPFSELVNPPVMDDHRFMYKILIIDDHSLVREGLRLLLNGLGKPVDCLEAHDCNEGLDRFSQADRVDLILLDLGLPGIRGIDAIRFFQKHAAGVPVVVVSASEKHEDIRDALSAGARGFLSKSVSSEVILGAVRQVLDGGIYVPSMLVPDDEPEDIYTDVSSKPVKLTPRQQQVLVLMALGNPNKAIAEALDMAESTVRVHATAIFKALEVGNRTEAAYAAVRMGLLSGSSEALVENGGSAG